MNTKHISTAAFLRPGELIADRYEVVRLLGSGFLGWVLEAKDNSLDGERVALKIFYPHLLADEQIVQRVQNEVLIARQLSHPNIIRIFDFDTSDDGICFIAMEYIDGGTLRDVLQSSKTVALDLDIAAKALYYVAKALAHAHEKGVVHRDLTPDNILVSRDGEIKISDFGIARSLEIERGLTVTGESLGTPGYMAPEQFSKGESSARSDIYSFGIIAWELVYGAAPFDGDNYYTIARQHIEAAIPTQAEAEERIPKWFAELIASCTRKAPEDRTASADEILKVIRAYQGEKLESRPLSVVLRRPRSRKEYLRFAGWFSLVVMLIGVLMLWNLLQTKTRLHYGAFLLKAEKRVGRNFPMARELLSIHGSLLDPFSAVPLIRGSDTGGEWAVSLNALLHAGLDPNLRLDNGETLLHDAVRWGDPYAVTLLLQFGALPDARNDQGQTPLQLAVLLGEVEKIGMLRDGGASHRGYDAKGQTLLHAAVLNADYRAVETLLFHGVNEFKRNAHGFYPLHSAAALPRANISKLLLRHGADPNVRCIDGESALHLLSSSEQEQEAIRTAAVLLAAGADPWALSNKGRTAVDSALLSSRAELAAYLMGPMYAISPPRWIGSAPRTSPVS